MYTRDSEVFVTYSTRKSYDIQYQASCGCFHLFQGNYIKARNYFERSKDFDFQSMYQLSVMMYDGIGGEQDCVSIYILLIVLLLKYRVQTYLPLSLDEITILVLTFSGNWKF